MYSSVGKPDYLFTSQVCRDFYAHVLIIYLDSRLPQAGICPWVFPKDLFCANVASGGSRSTDVFGASKSNIDTGEMNASHQQITLI